MRETLGNELLSLYAAATDEDLWRAALRRISRHLGADGVGVFFGDGAASAIAAGLAQAQIKAVRQWLSARAMPGDDATHWLLPGATDEVDLRGRHCVARLVHDEATVGYAALYREPAAPEFDAATIETLLTLAPHLAQALVLAQRLAAAELSSRRCAQCNEMLPFGCALLDESGSIIDMNGAAREMLDAGDGLRIADGRLRAHNGAGDDAIGRRLRDALDHGSAHGAMFASVARPSGRRPYALFLGRMSTPQSAFAPRAPRGRLVIVDTDCSKHVPREVLRALYHLTETESRVAWHLAGGDSIEQAAERIGIAPNTLRHHLERVFVKTGVHRQTDLVRLVNAPFVSVGGGP